MSIKSPTVSDQGQYDGSVVLNCVDGVRGLRGHAKSPLSPMWRIRAPASAPVSLVRPTPWWCRAQARPPGAFAKWRHGRHRSRAHRDQPCLQRELRDLAVQHVGTPSTGSAHGRLDASYAGTFVLSCSNGLPGDLGKWGMAPGFYHILPWQPSM